MTPDQFVMYFLGVAEGTKNSYDTRPPKDTWDGLVAVAEKVANVIVTKPTLDPRGPAAAFSPESVGAAVPLARTPQPQPLDPDDF